VKKTIIILSVFSLLSIQAQTTIGDGLTGSELLEYVQNNYTPASTMGYNTARDTMYALIDIKDGNRLSCVYTGFTITLESGADPSTSAYQQGINCEHTWPQSMGAGSEPQKSDMHHLFPCKSNVNSSRGNDPYAEIPDENTDKWYRNDYYQYNIPTEFIDEYAEKYNPANPDDETFEPREDHKGDAARAVFYFYAIYNDVADHDFWNVQKNVLLEWNYFDPSDEGEIERTWAIASYQDDTPNPFILDNSLALRVWFSDQIVYGCMDSTAINYNPDANIDDGSCEYLGIHTVPIPESFVLMNPYPNPFNPVTTLRYGLPEQSHVTLTVYDLMGREINRLVNTTQDASFRSVKWDGKDSFGRSVGAGVYLYKISAGDYSQTKKMILLK